MPVPELDLSDFFTEELPKEKATRLMRAGLEQHPALAESPFKLYKEFLECYPEANLTFGEVREIATTFRQNGGLNEEGG